MTMPGEHTVSLSLKKIFLLYELYNLPIQNHENIFEQTMMSSLRPKSYTEPCVLNRII